MEDKSKCTYEDVANDLKDIYERKNHDYGNSFHILYEKFGLESSLIRLWDKLTRFETLIKNKDVKVVNESIEDTLKDLANYCIMTLVEIENRKERV